MAPFFIAEYAIKFQTVSQSVPEWLGLSRRCPLVILSLIRRNPARANAAQSRNISGIAPGVEMPSKAEPHDGERPGLPGIAGASASLQGAAWVGPSLFPDFTHGVRLVLIRHSLRRIPCA